MIARAASSFPFYFTRDPEGLREMFAVSSSVGSGKTKAAIEYIAGDATGLRNILYVAPTIRLIEQTRHNLTKELTKAGSTRSVHVVHSQSRDEEDGPTATEVLRTINDTPGNIGRVVILTTVTFLTIVADIEAPEDWSVILDEAFSPVAFSDFYPGHGQKTREAHLAAFHSAFDVDRKDFFRVTPRVGMKETLRAAAVGDFRKAGSMMRGYQDLAKLTLNPALRTEVVATPKAVALLDACVWPSSEDENEDDTLAKLTLVSYATPEYFQGFAEVVFMSALFERTMLHALWAKVFGVTFATHPTIKPGRDLHVEQGQRISIGHLLHRGENASKHNLGRNRYDGAVGETEEGERIIDALVEQADEFFAGRKYLLQVNRGYGYDDDGSKLLRKYPNATKIPTAAHGLNDYQQWDNVAALAVTNPLPQHCEWIMARTGFTKAETNQSYRIHTTYQAVGRTSVRNPKRAKQAKVFLCVGYEDAKLLHDTFEGSQWLGRVGDVARLSDLQPSPKRAGAVATLADDGRTYLYALADTTPREISSRDLKAAIAPQCSRRTWTRVTQEIRRTVSGWRWAGSSFVRTDGQFYGFKEETAPA